MAEQDGACGGGYRARLTAGMAAALAEVGYAGLTIADIVRHARVSKRTFYEQFASKEACLLALYEAESERLLDAIERAVRGIPDVESRLRAGVAAYLSSLEARPAVVKVLFLEILAAGPEGLVVRRAVNRTFAALLRREVVRAGLPQPSPALAIAVVGGVNELILEAVEEDRERRLSELAAPVERLVRSVLFSVVPERVS